ncbi:MAG: magnesium transporter CorA, partial [Firmicutes bacterium]|nr:magnesium transporter CorA [Bacillota bacterium]
PFFHQDQDDAVSFMLALIPVSPERPLHHLSFIIGHHFLVTAHLSDASHVVDHAFGYVRQNHLMDEGVDFALYEVLKGHVVALRELANHLDDQFEDLHRKLLEHPYRDLAPDILKLRKRAMAAKHILDPEGAIFELLKSSDFPYVRKPNRPYFQDVSFLMDEVSTEVQATRDGLAEMVEAYT